MTLERPVTAPRPAVSATARNRRRFVDRDQIAGKLAVKRSEYTATLIDRPPLPEPVGYFRGRVLWDEYEIDEWVAAHTPHLR
jgi:predicted DNA-binding transcriptional regulator AlpA